MLGLTGSSAAPRTLCKASPTTAETTAATFTLADFVVVAIERSTYWAEEADTVPIEINPYDPIEILSS
ncbi:MAG: hypothetical protein J07HX5_01520 [halophilic archaeon J07HX5]|nr:MAG: hypothetical protein J07HX5_01520 [halophilic archaeon J07HX5]